MERLSEKSTLCIFPKLFQILILAECSNCPGIKLMPAVSKWNEKIEHLATIAHIVYTTAKTIHFTSWTRTAA